MNNMIKITNCSATVFVSICVTGTKKMCELFDEHASEHPELNLTYKVFKAGEMPLEELPKEIPGRDIFKQYLESGGDTKIVDILRKSMLKRFKGVKVAQQLEEAGQDIVKDIADFVYADKLKPENGPVYKKQKLDAPVGVYTGEMIDGLEAVYVRKP